MITVNDTFYRGTRIFEFFAEKVCPGYGVVWGFLLEVVYYTMKNNSL